MAPDYKTYLATEVLNEGKTVSYRTVSRALKVHVNAAKCMLYDFYQKESKKKPNSVYVTYVIAGTKKIYPLVNPVTVPVDHKETDANGDVPMPSSPPHLSSQLMRASQLTEKLEDRLSTPVKSITYCRGEALDTVKALYESISSIHIHSIAPHRIEDLATITETGRAVYTDHHLKQDPLIHNKEYGTIQNAHVWRRTGKRPTNVDLPLPKIEAKVKAAEDLEARLATGTEPKREQSNATTSAATSRESTPSADVTNKSKSKPKPNLKRDGSSLFKAFAKQATKPKLDREDTDASAASDSKMSGMDDNDEGEDDDDAMFLDTGTSKSKKRPNEAQKEKEERQAKLRKMMDDDADEPEVPTVADATDSNADPPAAVVGEDADGVDWSDSDAEKEKAEADSESKPEPEPEGPKRRRGKRKVMRKRTAKDEDGYLVTKEEEAWESFSEDEPVPAKKPAFPATKTSAPPKNESLKSSAPKSSAGGKKKDIMSFFGKK